MLHVRILSFWQCDSILCRVVGLAALLIVKYTSTVVVFIRGLLVTGVPVAIGAFASWVLVVLLSVFVIVVVGVSSTIVVPLTTAVMVLVSFVNSIWVRLLVPLNLISHLTTHLRSPRSAL